MQKRSWLPIKIISLLIVFLAFPRTASAYYTNMPASLVIGQPDFTSSAVNQGGVAGANTLNRPSAVSIRNGKMFVADRINSRILIFNQLPTKNNVSADVVIGQPDFTSSAVNQGGSVGPNTLANPWAVFSDGQRMYVSDFSNNRILIWNQIPTANNTPADVVIGQPNFTSSTHNQGSNTVAAANTIRGSEGIWSDGNKLIVADSGNNRVLIFNSIPTTNNASADVVIGQPDFASTAVNQGGAAEPNTLWSPVGVWVDNGKLFITDKNNNRILIFNSIPISNNALADLVIPNYGGISNMNTLTGIFTHNNKLFVSDHANNRILIYNSVPTSDSAIPDIVIGQPDFDSGLANQGGNAAANTLTAPRYIATDGKRLYVSNEKDEGENNKNNNRILIFEDYEATATPGFTVNYPPESSGEKMRLSGNIVLGEYGKFDLRSPEVSINNQGFGPLTNFSKRQHSDHETIMEFFHEFEPWAGVAPKDQWTEGDGFTAHFKATSYQSRIETQEAFLFWPFTLDSVSTEGAVPTFSFHMPSKNVDPIKSNLDRFEVYIGKEGSFSKYLKRVPVSMVGEDGRVIVSANIEEVLTAQATFLPGKYEVKVRAVDKWGNHFDSNALPLTLTQTLVSVESTPLFSGFWFPLQINRATGINTGIISSFRPESVKPSYTTTTLTPTFTGIAFSDSLITMTVVNNQNPTETKTYTTTTGPDSTWSLSPTLYPDSTVSITAQKAGLSAQIQPFRVQLIRAQ